MEFQPISSAPLDGTPIETQAINTVRFSRYKKHANQSYMQIPGAKGRWQQQVGPNTWINLPTAPLCWRKKEETA